MKSFVSSQKEHAVVLGGSFAGLLTAKVLSTRYHQVTIVEKDVVHRYPESRKGQPHTKHLHGLLPRGLQVLCSYFPGFIEEIVANGGIVADFGDSMNWFAYGGFKKKVFMGLKGYLCPVLCWNTWFEKEFCRYQMFVSSMLQQQKHYLRRMTSKE